MLEGSHERLGDDWVGRFEADLCERLDDPRADEAFEQVPPPLPRPRQAGRRPVPTRVSFTQDPAGERSIVEVETADQPGVLRRITAAFASMNIDIQVARVLTEARRVFDVFYVARLSAADCQKLEQRVQTYLRRS
jgi:[protein-PII] uridylyltransferase